MMLENTVEVPADVVNVAYSVKATVEEDETVITSVNAGVENGDVFTAVVNAIDENWTAEVFGATLVENTVSTVALEADAEVSVVYTYNGDIVTADDLASGLAGAMWTGISVNVDGGKISVTGLNTGDTVMLYAMNGVCLAQGTAKYDGVEFTAPNGTYLLSIVHGNNKIGVKVINK